MPADTRKTPTAREAINRQGLMDDMMARCSVDPLALIGKDGGQSYVEARAKCRACPCVGTCRDWLRAGSATGVQDPRTSAPIPICSAGCSVNRRRCAQPNLNRTP